MTDSTPTVKEKIQETIITLIRKQARYKNTEIGLKTHLDRDLQMGSKEITKLTRDLEVTFGIQLTGNAMVFLRDIESIVFYVETQVFKKISAA
jgi:acyl carrier protein